MAEQSVVQLFPPESDQAPVAEQLHLRALEAILFASAEPISDAELQSRLPVGADREALLDQLGRIYADRGVNLARVAKGWAFRTAPDLAHLMTREIVEQRRLSRAALETLSIIAYHQPVTRAEIEEIRGVMTSRGTIDLLMEIGWVLIRGRRQVPGRPVTYGTGDAFLEHFSLDRVSDLPGIDELAAAGLLERSGSRSVRPDAPEIPPNDDNHGGDLDQASLDVDIESETGA